MGKGVHLAPAPVSGFRRRAGRVVIWTGASSRRISAWSRTCWRIRGLVTSARSGEGPATVVIGMPRRVVDLLEALHAVDQDPRHPDVVGHAHLEPMPPGRPERVRGRGRAVSSGRAPVRRPVPPPSNGHRAVSSECPAAYTPRVDPHEPARPYAPLHRPGHRPLPRVAASLPSRRAGRPRAVESPRRRGVIRIGVAYRPTRRSPRTSPPGVAEIYDPCMSHRLPERDRPWMMRTYAGHSTAAQVQRAVPRQPGQGPDGADRSRSTCRRRPATTPTTSWPAARSARSACRSAAQGRHARAAGRDPARTR